MKVVVQKVKEASVLVNDNIVGKINHGLLVFVGFTDGDSLKNIDFILSIRRSCCHPEVEHHLKCL